MSEETTAVELTTEEVELVAEHRRRRAERRAAMSTVGDPEEPPALTWRGLPLGAEVEALFDETRGEWFWRVHAAGRADGLLLVGELSPRPWGPVAFDEGTELRVRP